MKISVFLIKQAVIVFYSYFTKDRLSNNNIMCTDAHKTCPKQKIPHQQHTRILFFFFCEQIITIQLPEKVIREKKLTYMFLPKLLFSNNDMVSRLLNTGSP